MSRYSSEGGLLLLLLLLRRLTERLLSLYGLLCLNGHRYTEYSYNLCHYCRAYRSWSLIQSLEAGGRLLVDATDRLKLP